MLTKKQEIECFLKKYSNYTYKATFYQRSIAAYEEPHSNIFFLQNKAYVNQTGRYFKYLFIGTICCKFSSYV